MQAPIPGVTGADILVPVHTSKVLNEYTINMANKMSANASSLAAGNKINSSRGGAALAGQAQALANQTGGNIMGFTYE